MWSRQSTVTSLWCSIESNIHRVAAIDGENFCHNWVRNQRPRLPIHEVSIWTWVDLRRPRVRGRESAQCWFPLRLLIAAKEQQSIINRMRNHTDKEISREKDETEKKIEPRSNNKTIEKEEKRIWLWQRAIIIQRWSALSSFFYIYVSYFLSNIREIIR